MSEEANWVASELLAARVGKPKEGGIDVHYKPTGSEWKNLPVQIRIRAVDEYKLYSQKVSALSNKQTQARLKNSQERSNLQRDGKPIPSNFDFDFFRTGVQPLQEEQKREGAKFLERTKEIFGLEQVGDSINAGWMVYEVASGKYSVLMDNDAVSTELDALKDSFAISGLLSNTKFEVVIYAKSGEEWVNPTPSLTFWTKAAEWELVLQRSGLGSIIPLFRSKGLDSVEAWTQLGSDKKLEELGFDASTSVLFKEVMTAVGIISAEEKARIAEDQKTLALLIDNMSSALKQEKQFSVGSPVIIKGKSFGVVTQNDGGTLTVRTGSGINAKTDKVKTKDAKTSSFDVFLSHAQGEAQNQVGHLAVLLEESGVKAWVDMDAVQLAAEDMCRGIDNSSHFIVFLTSTYFERYFCRMEAMMAQKLKKKLIIVYESDERHGGDPDYVKLVNRATRRFPEFKTWALSVEAIPMARRAYQRRALITELVSRLGLSGASKAKQPKQKRSHGTQILGTKSKDVEVLQNKVTDLQSEVEDLYAENKSLWAAIDELRKRL